MHWDTSVLQFLRGTPVPDHLQEVETLFFILAAVLTKWAANKSFPWKTGSDTGTSATSGFRQEDFSWDETLAVC